MQLYILSMQMQMQIQLNVYFVSPCICRITHILGHRNVNKCNYSGVRSSPNMRQEEC